ncbi:ChaN family lipoprotein [Crocinitomicaceae bacterium]|nr:ChaN family lipoprotein [Crocinitomicaceae bacterium]
MKLLIAALLFICTASFAQETAYTIYTSTGKKTTYKKMITELAKKDIILFGELHDNPIAHWLELEVTKSMDKKNDLTLGAEMFESDNQEALNSYLEGKIDEKGLDTTARLWSNHSTDYAPLIDYARDNEIPFIATNIPRHYASLVHKQGGFQALDSLSDEEKSWIAPLPIDFDANLPQYKKILDMLGDHATPDLIKAQAIKDATMAHFILANYNSGQFIHFNGAFHSNFYEGILWYLQQERPELNYGTISTVSQKSIHSLDKEYRGAADFIICVDEDMTSTY